LSNVQDFEIRELSSFLHRTIDHLLTSLCIEVRETLDRRMIGNLKNILSSIKAMRNKNREDLTVVQKVKHRRTLRFIDQSRKLFRLEMNVEELL
jgi:hypothetical protein